MSAAGVSRVLGFRGRVLAEDGRNLRLRISDSSYRGERDQVSVVLVDRAAATHLDGGYLPLDDPAWLPVLARFGARSWTYSVSGVSGHVLNVRTDS